MAALKPATISDSNFYRIGGDSSTLYDSAGDGGERAKPLTISEWDTNMTNIAMNGITGAASENAGQATKNISGKAMPYYADEIPPLSMAA